MKPPTGILNMSERARRVRAQMAKRDVQVSLRRYMSACCVTIDLTNGEASGSPKALAIYLKNKGRT
jgi:hypothetical protein